MTSQATKPAGCKSIQLWERACSRKRWVRQHIRRLIVRLGEQARSHILDLCSPAATEEISDKVLRLPLGKPLSSLRTPLQTQWAGVAARIFKEQKHYRPLSVDAFLASTVRRYGGCARDTFGYAGLLLDRSANLRTAVTLSRRGDQWQLHF